MKAFTRSVLIPLLLLASMPAFAGNEEAPAAAASSAAAAKVPPMDKNFVCADGYESLLPGDYYACRARYQFVRQHYGQVVEMLKEAAYWANKDAQYTLGLMYFEGDTPKVGQNRPLGLAWLALSAERKRPEYVQAYTAARLRSSPAEVAQANTDYKQLIATYGDKVAGLRAKRRFARNIKDMEDAANDGGLVWLSGFGPFPQTAGAVVNRMHKEADTLFAGMDGVVTIGATTTQPAGAQPATGDSTPKATDNAGH